MRCSIQSTVYKSKALVNGDGSSSLKRNNSLRVHPTSTTRRRGGKRCPFYPSSLAATAVSSGPSLHRHTGALGPLRTTSFYGFTCCIRCTGPGLSNGAWRAMVVIVSMGYHVLVAYALRTSSYGEVSFGRPGHFLPTRL
jgi:hypothetical protein